MFTFSTGTNISLTDEEGYQGSVRPPLAGVAPIMMTMTPEDIDGVEGARFLEETKIYH